MELDDDFVERFMEVAFQHARHALKAQEVPVGCVFVYDNKVLAVGRNEVNESRNATRHAEMICIDRVNDYAVQVGSNVFEDVSVFVTVEPCIMCMAALFELKVKSIYYGCCNDRFGGRTVLDVAAVSKQQSTILTGGFRAEEAMGLLKQFYQGTNPSAPPSKVKIKVNNK